MLVRARMSVLLLEHLNLGVIQVDNLASQYRVEIHLAEIGATRLGLMFAKHVS